MRSSLVDLGVEDLEGFHPPLVERDHSLWNCVVVAVAIVGCEGRFGLPAAGLSKVEAEMAAVRTSTAVVLVEDVVLSRHRPNQPYEEQVTLVEV